MKLNLGCGGHKAEGPNGSTSTSTCVCEHPECVDANPDLVCDIRSLPYDDGSVDAIYCGHVLEHLPEPEVIAVLREMRRVLKSDGRLGIVGPDYDRAVDHRCGWWRLTCAPLSGPDQRTVRKWDAARTISGAPPARRRWSWCVRCTRMQLKSPSRTLTPSGLPSPSWSGNSRWWLHECFYPANR